MRDFPTDPMRQHTRCLNCGAAKSLRAHWFCSRTCAGQWRAKPLAELFWSKVDKRGPDECWEWLGTKNRHGYGRLSFGRNGRMLAHRFALEMACGALGENLALHSCDNPGCVNPAHLRAGTFADNSRDMAARGRASGQKKQTCVRGHPFNEENTAQWGRKERRSCRLCSSIRGKAYRQRKRNEHAPAAN